MRPIEQLEKVLKESDLDVLNDEDYELLDKANLVDTVDKGKALAQFIKNLGQTVYNGAYINGRADQAYIDGQKFAEAMQSNDVSD